MNLRRVLVWGLVALGLSPLRAGEWSLLGAPQAQLQYEGTGFRQVPNGWELKVKPWNLLGGVRWENAESSPTRFVAQYWINRPSYHEEIGNAQSPTLNQVGQTRFSVQSLWVDARRKMAGSSWNAVGGLHGVGLSFHRKNIVFNGSLESQTAVDRSWGAGPHLGFSFRRTSTSGWYREGDFLFGRFLWTGNNDRVSGGSIRRGGYSYLFRLEGGKRRGPFSVGLGLTRQMYELLVPGGRALPTGAAASLPINKADVFAPYLVVSWAAL